MQLIKIRRPCSQRRRQDRSPYFSERETEAAASGRPSRSDPTPNPAVFAVTRTNPATTSGRGCGRLRLPQVFMDPFLFTNHRSRKPGACLGRNTGQEPGGGRSKRRPSQGAGHRRSVEATVSGARRCEGAGHAGTWREGQVGKSCKQRAPQILSSFCIHHL